MSLVEALNQRSATSMFQACKELAFSLERFQVSLGRTTGESIMSTILQRMWQRKAKKVCQRFLNLSDTFLDES
jgi:hypothetical protein